MLDNEKHVTLAEAARLCPGRPHASALWRHCRRGVKARNGRRIHLEHVRFGGKLYTSAEAVARFAQRLAAADAEHFDNAGVSPPGGPPTRRVTDAVAHQRDHDDTAALKTARIL